MLECKAVLYNQHIPGASNFLADCLSRDHHLSNNQFSALLQFIAPSQLPNNFRIVQMPQEIISFILSYLRKSPRSPLRPQEPMPSTIELSLYGINSLTDSNFKITPSWITSHWKANKCSLEHLQQLRGQESLASLIRKVWRQAQSERPFEKWVRFTWLTQGPTPQKTP